MASVRWRVALAVRNVVAGLNAQGVPAADVVLRKQFEHDPGEDRQPLVVVVSEKEQFEENEMNGTYFYLYPVTIGIVQERSLRPESAQFEADAREAIRNALFTAQPLPDMPEVIDCLEYDPQPAYSDASWAGAFDTSAQRFTFRVAEAGG
jgi:hypothetical protein